MCGKSANQLHENWKNANLSELYCSCKCYRHFLQWVRGNVSYVTFVELRILPDVVSSITESNDC